MDTAPKIATLARLAAAGLPVPAYVALPNTDPPDPGAWLAIDELLRAGPVIVRAALFGEDTAGHSGAGLGSSVAGCRDRSAVSAAIAEIANALADPWLASYFGGMPGAQVLVQREITGPWLAVVAQAHSNQATVRQVELHRRSHSEPLAAGLSPELAGPLELFPAELRGPIAGLCDRTAAALPRATHGLDLELVADHQGEIWVVQARPLTRPLHPGWPAFAAAARRDLDDAPYDPGRLPLPGLWTLDAEHNPAPLSPAHAGLIRRLAAEDSSRVGIRVLAGWLYTLDEPAEVPAPATATLLAALTTLQNQQIPTARAELVAIEVHLARGSADLPRLIDRAYEHLRRVLAIYTTLPARPTRLASGAGVLCLQGRGDHLDVLPASWDIASPTLRDLSFETSTDPPVPTALPDDPEVLATMLGELDDHLFALGLAPLRRVYLRAAASLALPPADIFLLTPDELQAALGGATFDLDARRSIHAAHTSLSPPLQIHEGLPVPAAAGRHLLGIAIGPVAEGPLHLRQDLAALLADPPPPGAVLAIPALTAQAAVVLRALGLRAVCCEHGGALSHAALMARELGLSALIGCRGCTQIPPGTHVRLDTRTGHLRIRPPA